MSEEASTVKPPAREVRLRWKKLAGHGNVLDEITGGSATLVGSKIYLAFNQGTLSVLSFRKWRWKSPGQVLLGLAQWHQAVLVGDKIFYFGQGRDPPLVEYDIVLGSARRIETVNEGPLRRHWKSCVFASCRNEIISFGGCVSGVLGRRNNETHSLNMETKFWKRLEMRGELPPARTGHKALMSGTKMYIYGGDGEEYQRLRHVWIAELGNAFAPFWSRPITSALSPFPRVAPLFNKLRDVIVVCGASDSADPSRKPEIFFMRTNTWQTVSNSQTIIEGEAPRNAFCFLSVDIPNGILYLNSRGVYSLTLG